MKTCLLWLKTRSVWSSGVVCVLCGVCLVWCVSCVLCVLCGVSCVVCVLCGVCLVWCVSCVVCVLCGVCLVCARDLRVCIHDTWFFGEVVCCVVIRSIAHTHICGVHTHATQADDCGLLIWVMALMWCVHVQYTNESCHTCGWVKCRCSRPF